MRKSLLMLSTILVLMMPVLMTVSAVNVVEEYRASFSCYVMGKCLILFDYALGPEGAPTSVSNGKGSIIFGGSGIVNQYPPNPNIPVTYYYALSGISALGAVSLKWNEESINLVLFSCGGTLGLFTDEGTMTDQFMVGCIPGQTSIPSMSYKGTYKDSTGVHSISGKAGVLVFSVPNVGILCGVIIYRSDNTPLLSVMWVPVNITFPMTLQAADVFLHRVRITG